MSPILMTYLTALATENMTSLSLSTASCTIDPAVFLTDLFWYLSNTAQPITRTGMDRMMDAIFTPVATTPFAPLLDDPEPHQITLANNVSQMSDLFKAHWKHIIIPAWNQHAEIRRACVQSQ